MRSETASVEKDLVLVGGGHSHIEVLRRLAMDKPPGLGLTLICRDALTPYSGMLPGHVAGRYGIDEVHIDLVPLCRFAGARLLIDDVVGLDPQLRLVQCRNRPPVPYDVLSINVGAGPNLADVPGAAEAVVPVKPIGGFLARWEALRAALKNRSGTTRIGVVGAGVGGVEILLAIQHRLREAASGVEFHLFGAEDDILPGHNRLVRAALRRILAARGVRLHLGRRIDRAEKGRIFAGDRAFVLDEVLWATDAAAPAWPRGAGLAVDARGFIQVDEYLRSISHPDIFAVGDVAAMIRDPRPKAGVYAVRQGPALARNLRRAIMGQALLSWRPQRKTLALITTGGAHAIASRGALYAAGRAMWLWKDRIDRKFMRRYNDLPAMTVHGTSGTDDAGSMRCGGCASKLGASTLDNVLAELRPLPRPDLLIGLEARDDAAAIRIADDKAMIHTVDHFRAFIDDPYRFGRIAANHALGDIYALNGAPQTALAIATVPYGPARRMEGMLRAMMAGANETLRAAGVSLIGGHSGEGAELALGFAVNGIADVGALAKKSGLVPGDRLILTKPIGTGMLFAADHRAKAKGRWIENALAAMQEPIRMAAQLLFAHGARACTDVTGFGLAGHLLQMTRASEVGAEIDLYAIPLLDGAVEISQMGIVSSLQAENSRAADFVQGATFDDPRFALLFDPQTAGGLLAGVPEDNAESCLAALRAHCPKAAIIGTVLPGAAQDKPIRIAIRPGSAP